MRGLLFAFGTQAKENKEVLWDERDENKGERKVIHREVYVKYFGYTTKREGYAKFVYAANLERYAKYCDIAKLGNIALYKGGSNGD